MPENIRLIPDNASSIEAFFIVIIYLAIPLLMAFMFTKSTDVNMEYFLAYAAIIVVLYEFIVVLIENWHRRFVYGLYAPYFYLVIMWPETHFQEGGILIIQRGLNRIPHIDVTKEWLIVILVGLFIAIAFLRLIFSDSQDLDVNNVYNALLDGTAIFLIGLTITMLFSAFHWYVDSDLGKPLHEVDWFFILFLLVLLLVFSVLIWARRVYSNIDGLYKPRLVLILYLGGFLPSHPWFRDSYINITNSCLVDENLVMTILILLNLYLCYEVSMEL